MAIEMKNTDLPDIINLDKVCQTYDKGRTWIIRDFDLLIEDVPMQGQFVVILGPSGCGKSTILRYICGLQKPTSGSVLLHGQPLPKYPPITMVFQQYSSFPWYTVLQNIMLPLKIKGIKKKEAEERARHWIDVVELAGHEEKYAKYPTLSGGQLQRVAIARSLITDPEILLLDEPFGALDINTRHNMQHMLAALWEKLDNTVIMVTHSVSEAVFLGDNIYVMSSCPACIIEHVHVDLPLSRTKETKRSPRFYALCHEVEDALDRAKTYHDDKKGG